MDEMTLEVVSINDTHIVVVIPRVDTPSTCMIKVWYNSMCVSSQCHMDGVWWPGVFVNYTYLDQSIISAVIPDSGTIYGNTVVVIHGDHLADDINDVIDVHMAGVGVRSIIDANSSAIVVMTRYSSSIQTGDVIVITRNRGTTMLSMGYSYTAPSVPARITSIFPDIGPRIGM